MDRIKITGIIQGKMKLPDESYAVGFRTKYGIVWITLKTLYKLKNHNKHLWKDIDKEKGIYDQDFIGRWLFVSHKAYVRRVNGKIIKSPIL